MPGIDAFRCILVIGATAGIGRALALAIHDLPNKPTVIVAGRRQNRLDELAAKASNVRSVQLNIDVDRDTLVRLVNSVLHEYPEVIHDDVSFLWSPGRLSRAFQIDGVIFSAGIQREFDFKNPESIDLDG